MLVRLSYKCKSKSLVKMFPDRGWNYGRTKTLIAGNDSSGNWQQ